MDLSTLEQAVREKVSENIQIQQEGVNRFIVFTPFMFDDGDHLVIVIRTDDGRIVLTDEGHTYMRVTHWIDERDLLTGARQTIISNALSSFGVQDIDGELIPEVPDHQYEDALFSFIQAILKISEMSLLERNDV
ncbi:MAG: DUF1828 domain-containing protein [Bacteroidota bacterium]|nr:DUF1828 domain-containing protein [Bacteroidota bacterium]MXW13973.1 DUF1828 domain-containing protein [Rhodothermaceae bacterium]MDE2645788.1 DUF1828 domain-containing protein [Bacteroidota bacterium]MXW32532.1 DUF1828 domain-containing protein [Rhodothermaceae bacterium]MYC04987.1 DUF1828 domain-containing protein [Rhodothermaceae bacterium]